MSKKVMFAAQPRTILGKKSKVLRTQKQLPANISGHGENSVPITVETQGFKKLYNQVGDTGLFYLTVAGEKDERPVLVSELQVDPLSGELLHVALRQVSLNEKVTAEVPVETVGEFALKDALVITVHATIEVEAFPQDLPEKFIIDVSTFTEIGQVVTFAQLDYDKSKVELKVEADQMENPVVMVEAVKAYVEEVPVVEAAPAEGATPAEGEAPAEGAKAADKTAETPEKK